MPAHAMPAPAIRIGGRRMSLPNRPRPNVHAAPEPLRDDSIADGPDYPRPPPPNEQHDEHEHEHDEQPKREKKRGHGAHDSALRARENAARRAEGNKPKHEFGAGGKPQARISQPAGKIFV